jgi:DNA polymerase III gamma/tau subunit
MMGNVETVRDLRDTFYYQIPGTVRSVVIDEAHMASRQAMSALLKVFEEAPANIKFLLCTTDADKLLPTIRSRSLEFYFGTQPNEVITKHILDKSASLGLEITPQTAELIALRSRGHLRNAHMLLDQYRLVGADAFCEHIVSAKKDVLRYFVYLKNRDKDKLFKSIDMLLSHPLADLALDWQQTVLDILTASLGQSGQDETTVKVASLYAQDVVKLVKMVTAPWVLDSFDSDVRLRTALLALYQLTETPARGPAPQVARNSKN